jgi:hypothetical protein
LVVSVGGAYAQAPASNRAKSAPASKTLVPDPGSVSNGVYRNPFFGFSYKIPYGWAERTADLQPDDIRQKDIQGNEMPEKLPENKMPKADEPDKSLVLLSVFARPPEAAADTVNSAVVIAAESVSSYPGLKTAADYFVPLTEVTVPKGFKVVNEPYDFSRGANPVIRGDFSKELGTLTMHQASLVTLKKGYVVSFTFIGGSDDEVQELVEGLSFASSPKAANPRSTPPKH